MENHVPTLATSQRLNELGYPQKSEFYWCSFFGFKPTDKPILVYGLEEYLKAQRIAAPLASELLERLPWVLKKDYGLTIVKNIWNKFVIYYECQSQNEDMAWILEDLFPRVTADTIAESAALMWIYLKEKGLI